MDFQETSKPRIKAVPRLDDGCIRMWLCERSFPVGKYAGIGLSISEAWEQAHPNKIPYPPWLRQSS